MKFRIALPFVLLGIFVASAQAQSNCCIIRPGAHQQSQTLDPTRQYIISETDTYTIACTNQQTSSACGTAPNNVNTGTGAGAYSNTLQRFVACNPLFVTSTSTTSSNSTFRDESTSYTGVDANGNCIAGNNQVTTSSCAAVACNTGCGGGCWPGPTGCTCSPIILDTDGKGFDLTDAKDGVTFDISGT